MHYDFAIFLVTCLSYLLFPSLFIFLVVLCICRYGSEPSIMKYIKIAAILRDKTVRDVALRCRWMMVGFHSTP